jgi:hypothetical protein
VRNRRKAAAPGANSGARVLTQFVYGDASVEQWCVVNQDGSQAEPWTSFERARQHLNSGQRQDAVRIWMQIAQADGIESRHTAQAWHFLRQAGYAVPADRARTVLGAVAEMPVAKGHDVLAAYTDGTARYLNYSGAALVWEDHSDTRIQRTIASWLAAAEAIASAVGTWDQPTLPPVPAGHARLAVLTPGGLRFGQGPPGSLSQDHAAGAFITAATSLLQLLTSHATR